jgi:hypothetical protein
MFTHAHSHTQIHAYAHTHTHTHTHTYTHIYAHTGNCRDEHNQFEQCRKDEGGNMSQCKFYYDVLSQCQQNDKLNQDWK